MAAAFATIGLIGNTALSQSATAREHRLNQPHTEQQSAREGQERQGLHEPARGHNEACEAGGGGKGEDEG